MSYYIVPFLICAVIYLIGFFAGYYWHLLTPPKKITPQANYIVSEEEPVTQGATITAKVTPLRRPTIKDIENKNKPQKQKDTELEMEKIFDEIIE